MTSLFRESISDQQTRAPLSPALQVIDRSTEITRHELHADKPDERLSAAAAVAAAATISAGRRTDLFDVGCLRRPTDHRAALLLILNSADRSCPWTVCGRPTERRPVPAHAAQPTRGAVSVVVFLSVPPRPPAAVTQTRRWALGGSSAAGDRFVIRSSSSKHPR